MESSGREDHESRPDGHHGKSSIAEGDGFVVDNTAPACRIDRVDDGTKLLDRRTGEKRWRFRTGGPVASSPWVQDGVLFVGSEDGKVYAVE